MAQIGMFGPAEQEVSQMLQELAYEAASRQQPAPTHVDLQQFLGLYLNHRPALQEPSDEVSQAFAALGADSATGRWVSHWRFTFNLPTAGFLIE